MRKSITQKNGINRDSNRQNRLYRKIYWYFAPLSSRVAKGPECHTTTELRDTPFSWKPFSPRFTYCSLTYSPNWARAISKQTFKLWYRPNYLKSRRRRITTFEISLSLEPISKLEDVWEVRKAFIAIACLLRNSWQYYESNIQILPKQPHHCPMGPYFSLHSRCKTRWKAPQHRYLFGCSSHRLCTVFRLLVADAPR